MRRERETGAGPPRRCRAGSAALAAALVVGSACTGSDSGEPARTAVTTTTQPPAPRVDDGVLRIGALLPDGEAGISASFSAVVQDAVDQINDDGGVLDDEVEVSFENEGDTAVTASQAIEDLVGDENDSGVDAIIGPISSVNAVSALDEAVGAGVLTCSPTASTIALDGFPANGLFFRTIAPDSLQAVAIAQQARETGATKMAIVHVDDAYGRPYADAVADELARDGSTEITTIAIPVDDQDLVGDLAELSEVEVAIVLGNGTDTARFLEAIGRLDSLDLRNVIVNDAARSSGTAPVISELPDGLRRMIIGVAPQIEPRTAAGGVIDSPFRPQIEDCVNLIALATVQGGSDAPGIIAGQMASVSEGGRVCRTFAVCESQLADGLQINYQGLTGITDLGRNGDPDRARFEIFRFDAEGNDVYDGESVTVSV